MEMACGLPRGQDRSVSRWGMPGGPAELQPQLAAVLTGTQNPALGVSSRAEGSLGNQASIASCELAFSSDIAACLAQHIVLGY